MWGAPLGATLKDSAEGEGDEGAVRLGTTKPRAGNHLPRTGPFLLIRGRRPVCGSLPGDLPGGRRCSKRSPVLGLGLGLDPCPGRPPEPGATGHCPMGKLIQSADRGLCVSGILAGW